MGLGDEKYIRLTTFRRSGTPVPSPVWVVQLDNGDLGFTTSSGSGKVKRLAHTERVLVQASDSRGRPTPGAAEHEATARLVTGGPELEEIQRKVKAKYGIMTSITKLVASIDGLVKRKRMPYGDQGVAITLTN